MRNVYIAKHLRRWVISERHFSLLGLLGPFYRFLFTTSFSWQEKRAHFLIMFFPTSYSTNNDAAIAFLPSHTKRVGSYATTVQLNFTQKTVVCEAWKMEK
jgi:hypothetical protein